ncbi:MAG: ornithine carbamoyltransferase, partial [Candidatus Nanoarchaeia archaeon]
GKESIGDVAKVLSRYVDAVMIRMHDHEELQKFMSHATVPVINGLTSYEHPCQILSDLLTIKEHKGKLKGLHLVYFGDSFNNVTHSLILAAAIMGMDITIVCPKKKSYSPDPKIIKQAKKLGKIKIVVTNKKEACKGADIIYTDSWISYRIPKSERKKHASNLKNCQVTKQVMKLAPKAMFMHDLPALRGMEVTKDVIDGKQSVVFDQAENRLHMQKAILLKLLSS